MTNQHSGFGFVEFASEVDAEYAARMMAGVRLFGKAIRINRANAQRKQAAAASDVGANLFIGSLSHEVDEKVLYDTFSRFGLITSAPKIMRDPETGESKGFAFVSYADFESSDAAIAALNGQFIAGRPVSVDYAMKKDSKGERHGSQAERLLANQRRLQLGQAVTQGRPPQMMMGAGVLPGPPPPMAVGLPPPPVFGMPAMAPPPMHLPGWGGAMLPPPPQQPQWPPQYVRQ